MEFETQYTTEQEAFRKEVREWLDINGKMPAELGPLSGSEREMTRAQWEWKKEFRRKLGHKGWLFATMPKEHGGGGLNVDQDLVIKEELGKYVELQMRQTAVAGLYVWGTAEQKERLLKPLLLGDIDFWNVWTEPDSGVDLASVKTTATRDGDDYVVNGIKCYISGDFDPDYMWMLAVTDPDAPRHANLGHFFMPGNLPGITMQFQDLINRGSQHFVFFDNVRVPKEYLVGGETQGWQVAQTALELEHGAAGSIVGRENVSQNLLKAYQSGSVHAMATGDTAREHVVNILIRSKVNTLLSQRNFWMFRSHQPQSYHGAQATWYSRENRIRMADDLLDLFGPHTLIDDKDLGQLGGRLEAAQRGACMGTHGAGSYEIDKVIIARRVGMSRTKEVAAPTH
ncbi:MAG: hypothetical protein EXR50_07215 [Dehalococcoidia bacterium]|nr:hypothetical protein [Dehalococcoidia bacterium]